VPTKEDEMKNMIAFCGLDCAECPALLATKNNDDKKREETAKLWSKIYRADIKAKDIDCEGCVSGSGRLFGHCRVCEIRKCGLEKTVLNCAHCDKYVCDKLSEFFKLAPEAGQKLDELRNRR
jgi:hypothetical protein